MSSISRIRAWAKGKPYSIWGENFAWRYNLFQIDLAIRRVFFKATKLFFQLSSHVGGTVVICRD